LAAGLTDRRGFALIATLWLLVAITAVALSIALEARLRFRRAAKVLEATRARRAAEAGLADIQARLAATLSARRALGSAPAALTDPWAPILVQSIDTVVLATGTAVVTLRDPGAQLNLNRATENELRRLCVALRLDAGLADRLAQRIADWRDPDEFRRPRGAERADYLRAGAAVVPANAAFTRLGELRDVLGMTPDAYDAVRPYLSLDGTGLVNLTTASRPVLLALPGLTESAVAVLEARRRTARPIRSLTELANHLPSGARRALTDSLPVLEPRITFETRELVATSVGVVEGSPVRVVARGLFARAGTAAMLVERTAE
jgi:general secretion pathway protein K